MVDQENSQALVPTVSQILDAPTRATLAKVVRAQAPKLFREHRKLEIWATAGAAAMSVVIGTALSCWLSSSPISLTTVIAGVIAAVLSVPITLGIIYCYYRYAAPVELYVGALQEWVKADRLLRNEQTKNGDAQITGDILEYSAWGKTEKDQPFKVVGMYFTVKIEFVNNSPAKTSVKNFYAVISVADKEIISGYAVDGVSTIDEQPSWKFEVPEGGEAGYAYANDGRTFDNLFRAPIIAEHTVTHVGWLQFVFAGIDLRHMYNGKAYVVMVDHKNRQHTTEPFAILPQDRDS